MSREHWSMKIPAILEQDKVEVLQKKNTFLMLFKNIMRKMVPYNNYNLLKCLYLLVIMFNRKCRFCFSTGAIAASFTVSKNKS